MEREPDAKEEAAGEGRDSAKGKVRNRRAQRWRIRISKRF
jgi:hypothetical protein